MFPNRSSGTGSGERRRKPPFLLCVLCVCPNRQPPLFAIALGEAGYVVVVVSIELNAQVVSILALSKWK